MKKIIFVLSIFILSSYTQAQQLKLTVEGDTTWYCISTPNRENLHLTSHGNNQEVTGTDVKFHNNQFWCLIQTKDNKFNLKNRAEGLFLKETTDLSTGNQAGYFRTTREKPVNGFSLSDPNSEGLFNIFDAKGNMINQCKQSENYKITTWNDASDPGNLFNFEEIDPTNIDVELAKAEAEKLLKNSLPGNAPGYFSQSDIDTFRKTIEKAITKEDFENATNTFKTKINTVKEGQLYFIESTGPDYCRNKILYNTKPTAGASLRWGDKTTDENTLWEFIGTEDKKGFRLRNKATGLYICATTVANGAGEVYNTNDPDTNTIFELTPLFEGTSFLIHTNAGNPIHAQNDYGIMVTWSTTNYGSASSWKIVPATEAEIQAAAQKTEEDLNDYQVIWQEEFDNDGILDETDWNFEEGFVRNYEAQWYQKDNAYIKDGNLIIEGRKEKRKNPWYEAGSSDWKKQREYIEYTSTSATTAHKHDFLYGRLEVRAKIPCSGGAWPAIWLLGYEDIAGEWPSSGEIDVMEYYSGYTLANLVWGSAQRWTGIWESRKTPLDNYWSKKDSEWKNKFHTWRMDWDEESIKLYLDNELITICNLSRTINQGQWHIAENPFHTPQYLLLNLAMGGQNGGNIDDSHMPMQYFIDYVRIYQKERHITAINNTQDDNNDQLIHFGKNSCNVNIKAFTGKVTATVFNLTGQILSQSIGQAENMSLPLNLKSLNSGIYILQVTDGKIIKTQKITIQ